MTITKIGAKIATLVDQLKSYFVQKSGDTMTGSLTIKKGTVASNTFSDANPKLVFTNDAASQSASLTFNDYDSVQAPASLTLNGNQGGEYFIAPYVKATSGMYTGGPIKRERPGGTSYIGGMTDAAIHVNKAEGAIWYPMASTRTAGGGGWAIGNYNDETLKFHYGTKANINSNNNVTTEAVVFDQNGSVLARGNFYRKSGGTRGKTPSANAYSAFEVQDTAGKRLAILEHGLLTDGTSLLNLLVLGHHTSSDQYGGIQIRKALNNTNNATLVYNANTGELNMAGPANFNARGNCRIYNGPNDAANGPGGALNNLVIDSWFGVSFTTQCSNQTYTGKTAVSINCRNGELNAASLKQNGTAVSLNGHNHNRKFVTGTVNYSLNAQSKNTFTISVSPPSGYNVAAISKFSSGNGWVVFAAIDPHSNNSWNVSLMNTHHSNAASGTVSVTCLYLPSGWS